MSGAKITDILRFLSQDAKVPLATALGKVAELQKANMTSAEQISKADAKAIQEIFKDEKIAKQVLNAAKRVSKKRGAPADSSTASPQKKKKKREPKITKDSTPFEIESSLSLPTCCASDSELCNMTVVTNRAPLVLAFAVCVLKYTMPEQPISSRLSLAQAVVSANSRTKAVSLGLESGQSAEQEGWGEGHPTIKVLGRDIRVLKRWDYNPREGEPDKASAPEESNAVSTEDFAGNGDIEDADRMPPLWGVDLEAIRKSQATIAGSDPKPASALPIYTAESARSYLLRSISKLQEGKPPKSKSAASATQEKEDCVGHLVHAIDSVCSSWATTLNKGELDRRAWAWYLRIRPDVQSGAQGWGEKGHVKLSDIFALRRDP